MRRRLIVAMLCVSISALGMGGVVAWSTGNLPICGAYTPNDPEWYLFFCYIDPPPKEKGA